MTRYITIVIFSITVLFYSCISLKPTDFTFQYNNNEYTGLDTLIRIDGYYITERECDSTFRAAFIFYPDGLFTIATGTDLSEIGECWINNDSRSTVCQYPSWGTYRIYNDTIKTQTIRQEGIGFATIFRDYLILADKSIVNINDYVVPENSNIGYMVNYPSFVENTCKKQAKFYPLNKIPDHKGCPYLTKKWFNTTK